MCCAAQFELMCTCVGSIGVGVGRGGLLSTLTTWTTVFSTKHAYVPCPRPRGTGTHANRVAGARAAGGRDRYYFDQETRETSREGRPPRVHACGPKGLRDHGPVSRQAGSTSLSESMKEREGSEVSQALTAASAKAPDDDEPASDAAGAGSPSESRPESMSPMPSEACTHGGGRQAQGREARERVGGSGGGRGSRARGVGVGREGCACVRTCVG